MGPLAAAVPLVAVEMWFDMRSRSRQLAPELCGAIGIASVASAIARAGGASWAVSLGLWAVLAARSITALPFVRAQVLGLKGRQVQTTGVAVAGAVAIALVVGAWSAGLVPLARSSPWSPWLCGSFGRSAGLRPRLPSLGPARSSLGWPWCLSLQSRSDHGDERRCPYPSRERARC